MDDHFFQRKKVGSIIQLKFFDLLVELTTFLLTNIKFKRHHLHLLWVKYFSEQGLPTSFKQMSQTRTVSSCCQPTRS